MVPLSHIIIRVDNTVVVCWRNRDSIRKSSDLWPLPRKISLLSCCFQVHFTTCYITGDENYIAYAAYYLTHISYTEFLQHFRYTFPHLMPWRLISLPSKCKRQLISILHKKQYTKDFLPQSTRRAPLYRSNGALYAYGCESPPTSGGSTTKLNFSRYSPSASAMASSHPIKNPYASAI